MMQILGQISVPGSISLPPKVRLCILTPAERVASSDLEEEITMAQKERQEVSQNRVTWKEPDFSWESGA